MSDKFYSYSDSVNDQINISLGDKGTVITTDDAMTIPPSELPKLIAVLQSHLEEPTDDRPWVIVTMVSNIIGPFKNESDALIQKVSGSDLVRQVSPPKPDIDHEFAGDWAKRVVSESSISADQNLARAYLELSAKQ